MKRIIVTAADDKFADMAMGLLQSLQQWSDPVCDTVAMLNLGLSSTNRIRMAPYVTTFVEPGWDFDIDAELRRSKPYLRALTARPWLRRHFPDHDLYLWLDADMWVQDRFAIDWFFQAAKTGAIGLVPSADAGYRYHPSHIRWRTRNLMSYFGEDAVQQYMHQPYYNAGAFALRADAPHWTAWADYFAKAIDRAPQTMCDQAALNYMLWKENLPVHPLPAICNWLCQYGIPRVNHNDGRLYEPYLPHRPIGIIHRAAKTKDLKLPVRIGDQTVEIDLGFEGRRPLLEARNRA